MKEKDKNTKKNTKPQAKPTRKASSKKEAEEEQSVEEVEVPETEEDKTEAVEQDAPVEGAATKEIEALKNITMLGGMYKEWFLDYASYVILERAVPHIFDGLKPVQRRILHSMYRLEDGRYNKVANIIGHTMQFHPHGDASIGDALVQIGQKNLLVDCQGNWGNLFTGDNAAASRYIEARLSKFALDVLFNPKTTEWKNSYDGRNKEPLTLPVKFPILLEMGAEGIAVGLASKILPHNFTELIDASIKYLKGQDFVLYPDFPTGGFVDVSRYNDGKRGGSVKVRARINQLDKKTLVITDIPFGKTTSTLIDSILKANDKGKIKIRKIDDNTAENVEILVHLVPGISPDITIDALYAFTDCELSISPNCCVIDNEKPRFIGVSEFLRTSTDLTVALLKKELEIHKSELEEKLFYASIEKLFIEEEMYEDIKPLKTKDTIFKAIYKDFEPHKKKLLRELTDEDVNKLVQLPIIRITKYDLMRAEEEMLRIKNEIADVKKKLSTIVAYAISYFETIRKKYSEGHERKTEIRNFETIAITQVAVANEKMYINREEGFIGTSLKKDEYVCDCSDLDDILIIRKDGTYKINKVADKIFVGKDVMHVAIFRKNDERTIYNLCYLDGTSGFTYVKRCAISGLTRDKDYTLTQGTPNSKLIYLTVNPNGEAEKIKVYLKPRPKLKNLISDFDFAELAIKGKASMGNILTRFSVHKIILAEKGQSTLGGTNIWFDPEVQRLNKDEKGKMLGEFHENDKILEVTQSGQYKMYSFDLTNHFEQDIQIIEKYNPNKIFTVVYYDAGQKFYYLKRFVFEASDKLTNFIDEENPESKLICISEEKNPQFEIIFGGKHKTRESEKVDANTFIAVKGWQAKGKRLTTYDVKEIKEILPEVVEEEMPEPDASESQDEIIPNLSTVDPNKFKQGSLF